MSRIERLTAEQVSLLPVFREEWLKIGLDTETPADLDIRTAIKFLYSASGVEEPSVVIVLSSPMMCELALNLLKQTKLGGQLGDQLGGQLRDQLWDQLRDQLGDQLRGQLRDQLRDQLGDQLRDQLGGQLWDQLGDQLGGQLRDQLWGQLRDQLGDQLAFTNTWCWGQQDAYWLALYEFGRLIGAIYKADTLTRFEAYKSVARSCNWVYPFKDLCIVSRKPVAVHFDERKRLHCEDGLAVRYSDGWGVFAWHGVRVPEDVILAPGKITAERIVKEPNAEIARIMMARMGMDRFLADSHAEEIDSYIDPLECAVRLYKVQLGDGPVHLLSMMNSTLEPDGTRKPYTLRVPPTITGARAAMAWTWELTEQEYAPVVET